MAKEKVLVAMSGGVDSSVAALLLAEQGFDVVGVSMHLTSCHRPTTKSCCSASDRLDARMVCDALGIKHHTLDYREAFREKVIQPFIAAYAAGRTPIPCISCNAELKFSALFEDMEREAAHCLATGHYARVSKDGSNRYRLFRGADEKKDQSYYLFQLTQRELARLIFPLGSLSKAEVRRRAVNAGLVTKDKPESQEICFVTDDDYVSFVEQHGGEALRGAGNFIDGEGKIVGRHAGIHAYTVGQRRGLGVGFGKRTYVVEIRPASNEVVLGSREDILKSELRVADVGWTMDPAFGASGHDGRYFDVPVSVRIRSMHRPAAARLIPQTDGTMKVVFEEAQAAISPGQAAVFYDRDEVVGGGWIQ